MRCATQWALQNTMQEVIDETPEIILTAESQHQPGMAPLASVRPFLLLALHSVRP
jgi:hypothetical protein